MNENRVDLPNGDFTFEDHDSSVRLKVAVDALKKANILEKTQKAEIVLDAAFDLLIEQQAEIQNLTNCVNFLQKTMENQANAKG